jgi:hypothetical protein
VSQPAAWWRPLYRGEKEVWRVLAVLVPIAVVGAVFVVWLAWGTASLVFAGLQALFAALAFVAAALAFWATWPQYRVFAAKPNVQWWVQWALNEYQPPERAPHHVVFDYTSFVVRVVVHNDGPGTFRDATVNIVVPELCQLEPLDPDAKGHYVSLMMSTNDKISGDGQTQRVRFSAARSNMTPGDHVFHARVTPSPGVNGDVPVLVEIDGEPALPESERYRRVVFSRYVRPTPPVDAG